jgi:hypothetical protein
VDLLKSFPVPHTLNPKESALTETHKWSHVQDLHTIYNAPTLLALHLCNHLVSKLQLMHYLHTPAFDALGLCIIDTF